MAEQHYDNVFTKVKYEVNLVDYLTEHMGQEMTMAGAGLESCLCPFHQEDTPSFYVSESSDGIQRWKCYGGCEGDDIDHGTIIDLVMKEHDFNDPTQAIRYLDELCDLDIQWNSEDWEKRREKSEKNRAKIEKAEENYSSGGRLAKAAASYLHSRGFEDAVIHHFRLGLTNERTMPDGKVIHIKSGRITIPFFDMANSPVALGDRAIQDKAKCLHCKKEVKADEIRYAFAKAIGQKKRGEEITIDYKACPHCGKTGDDSNIGWLREQAPKYWFPKGFDKTSYLYNEYEAELSLSRSKKKPKKGEENPNQGIVGLYLCEGQADVWATWASGQRAACSYNGKKLAAGQASRVVEIWRKHGRPIILIPDFDATGLASVRANIKELQTIEPDIEVRVVRSLGEHTKGPKKGEAYKDAGEVLQYEGAEELGQCLRDNTISAAEWLIREIVSQQHPLYPDRPFNTIDTQLDLVGEILSSVRYAPQVEHLVPFLSKKWGRSEEQVASFVRNRTNKTAEVGGRHLMRTIQDARAESREYLKNKQVIAHGFDEVDKCLPGGGAKLQQLAMFLGKSGTGKALANDEPVLTPDGWVAIGDLEIGDPVIGADGQTEIVMGVFPQGIKKAFRVVFEDGAEVVCCDEHLWAVRAKGATGESFTVSQLKHLILTDVSSWEVPTVPRDLIHKKNPEGRIFIDEAKSLVGADSSIRDILDQARKYDFGLISATQFPALLDNSVKEAFYTQNISQLAMNLFNHSQLKLSNNSAKEIRPGRAISQVIEVDPVEMTCISVSASDQLFITRDYIVTHNTMLMTQLLANMAATGIPGIFFSLEQPPAQLYMRMVCQVLDVDLNEAMHLIEQNDPALDELDEMFKDTIIIDNVPNNDGIVEAMTPGRVQRIIEEANMVELSRPAQVVAIDHLGIMQPPESAPASVQKDDMQAAGYIMQELFTAAKITNVYMMVLQQLPKEVPPGEEFGYDAGRGSSKQTDYCDYIYCIWRPEMQAKLDDAERRNLSGDYKLKIAKNRHGPAGLAHLKFDKRNLRILPALDMGLDFDSVDETFGDEDIEIPVGAVQGGVPMIMIPTTQEVEQEVQAGEEKKKVEPEQEESVADKPKADKPKSDKPAAMLEPLETDQETQDLIEALSAGGEDDIDPDLLEWLES